MCCTVLITHGRRVHKNMTVKQKPCALVFRELDEGLEEPISSIIWATPRLQSEVQELVIVADQLTLKYGKEFAQSCRSNALQIVNEKLVHKLSVQVSTQCAGKHLLCR